MIHGVHPFYKEGDNEKAFVARIKDENLKSKVNLSDVLVDSLFWKLCSKSPSERYTAEEALKHLWITGNKKSDIPMTKGDLLQKFRAE